jgi:heterodisulfide reductase subunit A
MDEDFHLSNGSQETQPAVRTGVVICECGGKISGILKIDAISNNASMLPGVVYVANEAFPCNRDGLVRLQRAIRDHQLERVLVAGCTPRLVEKLFREAAEAVGLERSYLEVADIRELCAFVHHDQIEAASQKAIDLIRMGVARLKALQHPQMFLTTITKSAMVVGSDLSGITVALALANEGIDVTLVEQADQLGGKSSFLYGRDFRTYSDQAIAISNHPHIQILLNTRISKIEGTPGNYTVIVIDAAQPKTIPTGAIILAMGVQIGRPDLARRYNRARVVTQAEYWNELRNVEKSSEGLAEKNVVMILGTEDPANDRYAPILDLTSIRQATWTKQLNSDANVTILFRDLYTGSESETGETEILRAKQSGVTFFRYRKDFPPTITDHTVDIFDPLTGQPARIPYDKVVLTTPLEPENRTDQLAALLNLPQDQYGFIIEERRRLRPEQVIHDGVFVVGGVHQPSDVQDLLFQAYLTSSRVLRFLSQEQIAYRTPIAEIHFALCTGCANCVQVCPTSAIHLEKQEGVLSLAEVDSFRCIGCGNCLVICPVKAISLPGWDDAAILAQIEAALEAPDHASDSPRILAFACEWSAYAAAEMAGVRHIPYPSHIRIIRLNCSARLDPYHILWAFLNGADGVFVGSCPRGECHYGSSNLLAEERIHQLEMQLAEHGFDPGRLHIEFLRGDDGAGFADAISRFSAQIEKPALYSKQIPYQIKKPLKDVHNPEKKRG